MNHFLFIVLCPPFCFYGRLERRSNHNVPLLGRRDTWFPAIVSHSIVLLITLKQSQASFLTLSSPSLWCNASGFPQTLGAHCSVWKITCQNELGYFAPGPLHNSLLTYMGSRRVRKCNAAAISHGNTEWVAGRTCLLSCWVPEMYIKFHL